MKYQFLEHTADIKFQAFGENMDEVFKNSALALKETICGKKKIKEAKKKIVKVIGKDLESLLYNFLEEILYLLDADNFIISKVKNLKISEFELKAVLVGDNIKNYKFTNKVKAVTYNEMFINEKKGNWISQVVLDV